MTNQDVIATVRSFDIDIDRVTCFTRSSDGAVAFLYVVKRWGWQFFWFRKYCSRTIRTLLVAIGLVSVELVAFEDVNSASIYRPCSIFSNRCVTNQDVIAAIGTLHVDIDCVTSFASAGNGSSSFPYFIEGWCW